jgi:hypothetical protein
MAGLGCGSWLYVNEPCADGEKELLQERSDINTRDITYRDDLKGSSQRGMRLQRPPPFQQDILSS